jgi:hypothetical protein
MDDDPDPRLQLMETLRQRSEEDAEELAAFDTGCLRVAQQCVDLWHRLWRETSVAIDGSLEDKFRICFPLAAHALNHVDAALDLYQERPLVAASSARVAFEHALAAQWVFLTVDGEQELVNWMKRQQYVRAKEFADALGRLASDPSASGLALHDARFCSFCRDLPVAGIRLMRHFRPWSRPEFHVELTRSHGSVRDYCFEFDLLHGTGLTRSAVGLSGVVTRGCREA